jgi:hypothetical protein
MGATEIRDSDAEMILRHWRRFSRHPGHVAFLRHRGFASHHGFVRGDQGRDLAANAERPTIKQWAKAANEANAGISRPGRFWRVS